MEFERLEKALMVVERYENYLFRRALGIALIVCGVIFPLTAFTVLNSQSIAKILNISIEAFLMFVPTIILLIGLVIIIYSFTSAHVITSRMRKDSFWKAFPHMTVIFLVWFLSFYLTNYVPDPFSSVSSLWAGGVASSITYLIMRREQGDWNYPELLIVSIICIVSSLPLVAFVGSQIVETIIFIIFSISFIAGGFYSIINASKVLDQSKETSN